MTAPAERPAAVDLQAAIDSVRKMLDDYLNVGPADVWRAEAKRLLDVLIATDNARLAAEARVALLESRGREMREAQIDCPSETDISDPVREGRANAAEAAFDAALSEGKETTT